MSNQLGFEPVRRLKLTKPIHFAGEEITELGFREPTCKVLTIIETSQQNAKAGQSVPLLAHFTGIGVASLERMSLGDSVKAIEIVGELMIESGLIDGEAKDEEGNPGKP